MATAGIHITKFVITIRDELDRTTPQYRNCFLLISCGKGGKSDE